MANTIFLPDLYDQKINSGGGAKIAGRRFDIGQTFI
jgi:hypothetical protein